jgi:hypothetical protein
MNLGDWRSRIDDPDDHVLHLRNQRAEAPLHTGDLNRQQAAPPHCARPRAARRSPRHRREPHRPSGSRTGGPAPAIVLEMDRQLCIAGPPGPSPAA